jgi:chemotaxis-related protein WspD
MSDARLDDCWNRIGVRGDASCPRLAQHGHCRNCPVYADAAALLLDRPLVVQAAAQAAPGADPIASPSRRRPQAGAAHVTHAAGTVSVLVFRIGDEWLAVPTGAFRLVSELRVIHSLPHRRSRAVLGVVNVRGALTVCVSLVELLGLNAPAALSSDDRNRARLLVLAHQGESAVFPVDEVDGVHRFASDEARVVPATATRAGPAHTRALYPWRGTMVGLLDAGMLFATLNRSVG